MKPTNKANGVNPSSLQMTIKITNNGSWILKASKVNFVVITFPFFLVATIERLLTVDQSMPARSNLATSSSFAQVLFAGFQSIFARISHSTYCYNLEVTSYAMFPVSSLLYHPSTAPIHSQETVDALHRNDTQIKDPQLFYNAYSQERIKK
jgi:hypothetical protein